MDIENAYNYRKTLYENKDLFFNLKTLDIDDKINLDEYEIINNNIIKGKEILNNELVNQSVYDIEKKAIMEIDSEIKKTSLEFSSKLENLKNLINSKNNNEDIQNYIDNIMYSFDCIKTAFAPEISSKLNDLNKKIIKSHHIIQTLSKGYGILKNSNIGYTCPICINNQVDVFIQCCGHTYCEKCISKSNYCYMCRIKVDKVSKLYFS
jgi:hypothetical protein